MRFFSSPRLIQLLFPNWIWKGPENNVIYLTFDDGPTPESTPYILGLLKKNDIKATFFCVGEQAIKSPELIEQIVEEGHSIGNHTMYHENGWKTKTGKYLDSITQSAAPIDSHLFRPPYGKIRFSQSKKIRELGYKIIGKTLFFENGFFMFGDGFKKSGRRGEQSFFEQFHDKFKYHPTRRTIVRTKGTSIFL